MAAIFLFSFQLSSGYTLFVKIRPLSWNCIVLSAMQIIYVRKKYRDARLPLSDTDGVQGTQIIRRTGHGMIERDIEIIPENRLKLCPPRSQIQPMILPKVRDNYGEFSSVHMKPTDVAGYIPFNVKRRHWAECLNKYGDVT